MSTKFAFISDFFQEIGGGEMVDARLREILCPETPSPMKLRSVDCNFHSLEKIRNYSIIVSNFTALSEEARQFLIKNCNYIIWEHDHKYLKTRNPSVFKDWLAPKDQLQFLDFYKAAKSVVCQTKQHLDVVFKNTGLTNLVNYGGSIWSNEQLDYLAELGDLGPAFDKTAILDSEIVHKGTRQAIEYCKQKNIEYTLLEVKDWKEFISDLNNHPQLIFFPQVLETCSRIAVEARMLGLKVLGNNNLSALKEDWFKEYKGKELIEYFREKNKTIKQFVDSCFNPKIEVLESRVEDITVILNLYKRPQNLQKQIDAFRSQTVKPKEIWVWQNNVTDDHFSGVINIPLLTSPFNGVDKWITSNYNWKYTGRFTLANLAQTKYLCLSDDDSIPGPEWLENAINTMKKYPGLMGGVGVVLSDDTYSSPHIRYGWPHPNHYRVEEVDLVGHSWVFKKEWLKYFWMEEPASWETCEDLHFSYCLQKYGNIKTYVPIQDTKENTSSQFGYELGIDAVASSNPKNHSHFYSLRDFCVKEYLKRGWKRIK